MKFNSLVLLLFVFVNVAVIYIEISLKVIIKCVHFQSSYAAVHRHISGEGTASIQRIDKFKEPSTKMNDLVVEEIVCTADLHIRPKSFHQNSRRKLN